MKARVMVCLMSLVAGGCGGSNGGGGDEIPAVREGVYYAASLKIGMPEEAFVFYVEKPMAGECRLSGAGFKFAGEDEAISVRLDPPVTIDDAAHFECSVTPGGRYWHLSGEFIKHKKSDYTFHGRVSDRYGEVSAFDAKRVGDVDYGEIKARVESGRMGPGTDFGSVQVGEVKELPIPVTTDGWWPVTIVAVESTRDGEPDAGCFWLEPERLTVLPEDWTSPGESQEVRVSFSPIADGKYEGRFVGSPWDGIEGPVLSGRGVGGPCSSVLRGNIAASGGEAAEGSLVTAIDTDSSRRYSVRAGRSGDYEIENLKPGCCIIEATLDRDADGVVDERGSYDNDGDGSPDEVCLEECENLVADIQLAPEHGSTVIQGTVGAHDGSAASGGDVVAINTDTGDDYHATVAVDGSFEIKDVPPGCYILMVMLDRDGDGVPEPGDEAGFHDRDGDGEPEPGMMVPDADDTVCVVEAGEVTADISLWHICGVVFGTVSGCRAGAVAAVALLDVDSGATYAGAGAIVGGSYVLLVPDAAHDKRVRVGAITGECIAMSTAWTFRCGDIVKVDVPLQARRAKRIAKSSSRSAMLNGLRSTRLFPDSRPGGVHSVAVQRVVKTIENLLLGRG